MRSLRLKRIRDALQERRVVSCEGRYVASVYVLGAGEGVVVVSGADAVEGCVNLGLPRDERGERSVVGLWMGMGWSPVMVQGTVSLARASIKRRVPCDSAPFDHTRRRGSVGTELPRFARRRTPRAWGC